MLPIFLFLLYMNFISIREKRAIVCIAYTNGNTNNSMKLRTMTITVFYTVRPSEKKNPIFNREYFS